jgi:hypothetical protein
MKTPRNLALVTLLSCVALSTGYLGGTVVERPVLAQEGERTYSEPNASAWQQKLSELRTEIGTLPEGPRRARFRWVSECLSRTAEEGGNAADAASLVDSLMAALRGEKEASDGVRWFDQGEHEGPRMLDNGSIGIVFQITKRGIALHSLFDLHAERELLSGTAEPFWSLRLGDGNGKSETLDSATGLGEFRAEGFGRKDNDERTINMEWRGAPSGDAGLLLINCEVSLRGQRSSWRMRVDNSSEKWSIRNITFPRVCLGVIGDSEEDDSLAIPHGSGELRAAPIQTKAEFSGRYPGGWCSMQLLSHYDPDCGLYFAVHDPFASTKDLKVKVADDPSIEVSFAWPAPDSGLPGNDWECAGEAVLQAFRGDWFDAARIYKRWAAEEAKWWPGKSEWGRSDTPAWPSWRRPEEVPSKWSVR